MNNTIELNGYQFSLDSMDIYGSPFEYYDHTRKYVYAFVAFGNFPVYIKEGKMHLRCVFDDEETRDLKYNQIKQYKER